MIKMHCNVAIEAIRKRELLSYLKKVKVKGLIKLIANDDNSELERSDGKTLTIKKAYLPIQTELYGEGMKRKYNLNNGEKGKWLIRAISDDVRNFKEDYPKANSFCISELSNIGLKKEDWQYIISLFKIN